MPPVELPVQELSPSDGGGGSPGAWTCRGCWGDGGLQDRIHTPRDRRSRKERKRWGTAGLWTLVIPSQRRGRRPQPGRLLCSGVWRPGRGPGNLTQAGRAPLLTAAGETGNSVSGLAGRRPWAGNPLGVLSHGKSERERWLFMFTGQRCPEKLPQQPGPSLPSASITADAGGRLSPESCARGGRERLRDPHTLVFWETAYSKSCPPPVTWTRLPDAPWFFSQGRARHGPSQLPF